MTSTATTSVVFADEPWRAADRTNAQMPALLRAVLAAQAASRRDSARDRRGRSRERGAGGRMGGPAVRQAPIRQGHPELRGQPEDLRLAALYVEGMADPPVHCWWTVARSSFVRIPCRRLRVAGLVDSR